MYQHSKIKITPSSLSIIFIAVIITSIFFIFDIWKENRITIDAPSYYAFLPSTFIYKDLKLDYVDKNPSFFKDKIWFNKIPNGNRIIKHSMGISVALLPFFLIGHVSASLFDYPQDGYSLPYQNAMSIGVIIYLLIGLHFLRKVLLNYFSENVVAITLLSIVVGTNLLWYVTFEGFMSHGLSFSLICICMYSFHHWMTTGKNKYLVLFSILFGLVVLIRPMSIYLLLYFIILGIYKKDGFKNFFLFIKSKLPAVFLALAIFLIIFFPQLLYWKYISGHWYFDTYTDEHFYFSKPEVLAFLFSFRKGWLIYTPILWFGIAGLIHLYKFNHAFFIATSASMILAILLFSSWWDWSYGYCYGMRTMIDTYGMLSFPLAATFSYLLSKKRIISYTMYIGVIFLVSLNLFQTWQYKNGLIHYDYMTKQAYFKGFFQTSASLEWYDLLKPYNFHRREMGLPQIEYTKDYFAHVNAEDLIYLRGYNLAFLSVDNPHHILVCNRNQISNGETFHLIRLHGDTIAIQSSGGKFLSVKYDRKNIIVADMDTPGLAEQFIFRQADEDDNKITLQAGNGNYISVIQKLSDVVCASGNQISSNETFRFYILDKQ